MTGDKSKFTQLWNYPGGLRGLIIALLVLGIFFRFVNLDRKVYWGDEVFTSLRIAGYTLTELTQELFDGKAKSIEELQHYQRPNPERNLTDTVKALAIEDAQHPPLYYSIAWLWERCLGSSIAAKRSLPALISLFVFPCLYWLCLELFGFPLVGWVAMALVAVSPFHVLYAQEVREYSLWTGTILLSSWALLRAIRLNTKASWVTYAVTLFLALYTYLFSVLVVISHGIYVVLTEGFQWNKTVKLYIFTSLAAFLTFAPWLFFVGTNLSTIQNTTAILQQQIALPDLFQIWGFNLSRIFIDLNSQGKIVDFGNSLTLVFQLIIIGLLVILVGYSITFLCRQTPKRTWLFILTLMGVTGLALILPDLIWGGIRSSATRYLVPCYLGIQLAVAYTISKLVVYQESSLNSLSPKETTRGASRFCRFLVRASCSHIPLSEQDARTRRYFGKINLLPSHRRIFKIQITKNRKRQIWQFVMGLLITAGVLSCTISSQAESWWNKYGSYDNPQIARIVNQAQRPLLLSSAYLPRVLSLSYLLQPEAKVQFISAEQLFQIPDGFSDVFFYRPSEKFKSKLEKYLNYKIETVYQSPPTYAYLEPISRQSDIWLWKLVKH